MPDVCGSRASAAVLSAHEQRIIELINLFIPIAPRGFIESFRNGPEIGFYLTRNFRLILRGQLRSAFRSLRSDCFVFLSGASYAFRVDGFARPDAECSMKIKTSLFALLILAVAAGLCFAAGTDAFMGTWKLNESKSKIPEGAPKNTKVVYAQDGDEVTVTVDGTEAGKAVHHVWTGKFDGKEYSAKGSDMHNGRAYTKVDARTLTYTVMKDGKKIGDGKVVIAADGKSRKVTETDTTADGKQLKSTAVYDKE